MVTKIGTSVLHYSKTECDGRRVVCVSLILVSWESKTVLAMGKRNPAECK